MTDFRTFPITPDLLSVPEQHMQGVAGAHRILMQITADHHGFDAGTNDLGTRGVSVLLDGLEKVRRRFSVMPPAPRARTPSPNRYRMMTDAPRAMAGAHGREANGRRKGELWGMRHINLARNNMDDDALLSAVRYAKRDLWMRELLVQDNRIRLADVVDDVVELLNDSPLVKLSLSANPLSDAAVSRFFQTLDAPKLRELHMSACGLSAVCVPAICDFLCSPRSQRLGQLELNGNQLTRTGVTKILDAIEAGNFTIERIGLFGNNKKRARLANEDQGPGYFGDEDDSGEGESDESVSKDDPRSMTSQIERRVPALQKRNGKLTRRVRNAAARALAPTRIIVHAQPPAKVDAAAEALEDVTLEDKPAADTPNGVAGEDKPDHADQADKSEQPAFFPLLELPVEVQFLIARHASGDAVALSDAQWARVLTHASDRSNLSKLAERTSRAQARVATFGHTGQDVKRYKMREVRDEWLVEMKCNWWEVQNKRYWEEVDRSF